MRVRALLQKNTELHAALGVFKRVCAYYELGAYRGCDSHFRYFVLRIKPTDSDVSKRRDVERSTFLLLLD